MKLKAIVIRDADVRAFGTYEVLLLGYLKRVRARIDNPCEASVTFLVEVEE